MDNEGLPIAFIPESRDSSLEILRAAYRQALIEVGHSPDYHLYDLARDFLVRKQDYAAGRFLLSLYDFYHRQLDELEQMVFICDFLERGRHYRFWWFPYFEARDLLESKNVVSDRLHTILNF
jgi:hypothetical protein